jgi:hypothetical protein
MHKIDNQQGYGFNEKQLQVLISGFFGDGCFKTALSGHAQFSTNSIHKEFLEYKIELLGDLVRKSGINTRINKGYKIGDIHSFSCSTSMDLAFLKSVKTDIKLSLLNDLGVALWFYDDGSLHHKNGFYNLNTHAFSEEDQIKYFLPFFKEYIGYEPKILKDRKKDGRVFSYLYFNRMASFEIAKILNRHRIDCFSYKQWPSETIQKWSKLQAKLKSNGVECRNAHLFSRLLKKEV